MRIFGFFLATAFALVTFAAPKPSSAQLYVSISAPPPLQMEMQPQLSNPNYIWTPGYWAMGPSGYYWVGGSWTQPPQQGSLWTPGYWGYSQNQYNYNQGYWGPQVGYYGGINYGNGYYGNGYNGGYWQGNNFLYNTAVSRVNTRIIRRTYVNRRVVIRHINRTSYDGGRGGLRVHPDSRQLAYAHERHIDATQAQRRRAFDASRDRHDYARPDRYRVNSHVTHVTHVNTHAGTHVNSHVNSHVTHVTHVNTRPPAKVARPAGQPGRGGAPNAKHGNRPPA
jgi:hypothetical protein